MTIGNPQFKRWTPFHWRMMGKVGPKPRTPHYKLWTKLLKRLWTNTDVERGIKL